MMNFVAIDFETATAARNSACSVAVVEVKDGKIINDYYTLIKPPNNYYHWYNTKIHGLSSADTASEADFAQIWPSLYEHLHDRIVIAHNASFDMSVLKACLTDAGIKLPRLKYCDTVAIAKKNWPNLTNHKLDTIGKFLQIKFNHHNALDDARTCAAIPLKVAQELAVDDLEALALELGVTIHQLQQQQVRCRR